MNIKISDLAQVDLLDIWDFLAAQNVVKADHFLDSITAQFAQFITFPEMGRCRTEFGKDYRSFVVGDYLIFYRILGETIEISRVLHGSRNLEDFL
jgi:toxin ParE1/3/4